MAKDDTMGDKKKRKKGSKSNTPSPCIDICKYPDGGFCKGCGMLKNEKKAFKQLPGKAERRAFFEMLIERLHQQRNKRLHRWVRVYGRKCAKKEVPNPLDELKLPEPSKGPGSS